MQPKATLYFTDHFSFFYERVNVLQGVYLIQHSLNYLRKSHGVILAVSSLAGNCTPNNGGLYCCCHPNTGWVGTTSVTAYSASKHALHGMQQMLQLITMHPRHFTGFFSTLNMELEIRQENISVVVRLCLYHMCSLIIL